MKTQKKTPIRKILVPLDPSDYAKAATEYACQVATAHGAQVAGLAVLDSPEIRSSVIPSQYGYLEMVQEAAEAHREKAKEEIAKFELRFSQTCREHAVAASEIVKEGMPIDHILEAASLFDLMVVGLRTFFHFETREGDGELLSKILGRTSTPILAVPDSSVPLKKVLVAYDGSAASARAVRDFVLFAPPFELEIDLFLADDDSKRLDFHANKLVSFFEGHEVPVHKVIRYEGTPLAALEAGVVKECIRSEGYVTFSLVPLPRR